jgi:hypothetical protein
MRVIELMKDDEKWKQSDKVKKGLRGKGAEAQREKKVTE